ncbi:hypothetical protein [Brevibacillus sp. 179-C8.5 HS]
MAKRREKQTIKTLVAKLMKWKQVNLGVTIVRLIWLWKGYLRTD